MGQKEQVPSPKGEVRRSWLLGSIVHHTLRLAHLAGIKEAMQESEVGSDTEVSDEGIVEAGNPSGVDR